MWFYVQMWFPLLTIALTAGICFSVVSFIMGQPKHQMLLVAPDQKESAQFPGRSQNSTGQGFRQRPWSA